MPGTPTVAPNGPPAGGSRRQAQDELPIKVIYYIHVGAPAATVGDATVFSPNEQWRDI